jgi:DNA-binding transcriptional ArsR family regulator
MKELPPDTLDELLRALSHSDRRVFLARCRDREVSAGDLASSSSLALASVSEHLRVLRKTGLLVQERSGRHLYYRTDKVLLHRLVTAVANLET